MAAIAEFPALIKTIVLTPTFNNASIFGVVMNIRGKPWVVTVDYNIFMYNAAGINNRYTYP